MNEINKKQNDTKSIRWLAAQNQLYADAKFRTNVQIALGLFLPPIVTVVCYFFDPSLYFQGVSTVSVLALYSLLTVAADVLYLDEAISSRISLAATIQQRFDCYVFGVDSELLYPVEDYNEEQILALSSRYLRKNDVSNLHGWYVGIHDELPSVIAILICQRQNIYWSSDIRSGYMKFVKILSVVSALVILAIALARGMTVMSLISNTLAPILPVVLFCCRQSRSNIRIISLLTYLLREVDSYWERVLGNERTNDEILKFSNALQNEIFMYRQESTLVPDVYYFFNRDKNENLSNDVARDLAQEYLTR